MLCRKERMADTLSNALQAPNFNWVHRNAYICLQMDVGPASIPAKMYLGDLEVNFILAIVLRILQSPGEVEKRLLLPSRLTIELFEQAGRHQYLSSFIALLRRGGHTTKCVLS